MQRKPFNTPFAAMASAAVLTSVAPALAFDAVVVLPGNGTGNSAQGITTPGLVAGVTLFGADGAMAVAVPEPESYAMMLAGLVAVGWISRRSNTAAKT